MPSVLNVDTLTDAAGTGPVTLTKQSAAKAWQNLNGSSFATRDTFNTASSTDNGTGSYTHTLTNAMSDANYVVLVSSQNFGSNADTANNIHQGTAPTTTAFRFQHVEGAVVADAVYLSTSVDGDLA